VPLKEEEEIMPPDEYQQLPEEQRKEIEKKTEEIQGESQKVFQKIPQWQKEIRNKTDELNNEVARYAISFLIEDIRKKYGESEKIKTYLDEVEKDILKNLQMFMTDGHQEQGMGFLAQLQQQQGILGGDETDMNSPAMRRYKVNLIVDHSGQENAPVIYEDNPTYANLVGKVEHMSQMGALITDFNLIKSGSLHRANGGALIIDARKILTQPGAWDGLKRALKSECIKIESLAEMLSLLSTVMLDPEPVPLDVKVIMIGSPYIYYLIQHYDPEFSELFKVAADFDVQMSRNDDNQEMYARLLRTLIEKEEYPASFPRCGRSNDRGECTDGWRWGASDYQDTGNQRSYGRSGLLGRTKQQQNNKKGGCSASHRFPHIPVGPGSAADL
jgi:predicted ATP-dependent protease